MSADPGGGYMDFGTRLKELLREKNLRQREFAEAIRIAPSTVGNYVRGLREPDQATLKKIAAYLGVSTDYLLGMDTDKADDQAENELLQIYRSLGGARRRLLLEEAKLLLRFRCDGADREVRTAFSSSEAETLDNRGKT